eukprot:GEZU01003691.1.p1 GENE.GEZU01003691.1~~GEZU01003691.1.p1  ORF type:complete len:192 (+),score=83.17 GEZU01003691.1:824-1399(+)
MKFLSEGTYRLFVIKDHEQLGGAVAACALVVVFNDLNVLHLDYVCVSSKVRGGGLGSIMFKGLTNMFRAERATKQPWVAMTLQCQPHLLAWYQKMGAIDAGLVDLEEDGKTFKFLQVPLCPEDEAIATTEDMETIFDELYARVWTPAELANIEIAKSAPATNNTPNNGNNNDNSIKTASDLSSAAAQQVGR